MKLKRNICFVLFLILIATPLLTMGVSAADENVAFKKSYTLVFESPIENGFANYVADDSSLKLTNGVKSGSPVAASDSAWLRLYRGTSIAVTIDLGAIYSVNKVDLGQLQITGAGIESSRYVYAAVSEDGENFGTLGSIVDEKTITDTSIKKINRTINFDGYYKARYVRVIFTSDVWTYVDEIEVMGTEDTSLGATAPIDTPAVYTDTFPTDVDGLRNIMLMYSGKYNKGTANDVGSNTYEELLPYFAYLDKSLNVTDTMFDSMLFLPLTPNASVDDKTADYSFAKQTGWQYYLDNVIGAGETACNLTALNQLVNDYKTQLNLGENYKYPVYISIPFIELSNTVVFGEIDGELIVPSTLESRLKIVKWFVDEIISSFDAAEFENVQLNGFYWQNELVPYTVSEYEDDLIIGYNAYVHSKDYSSIWIPYYCAPGYETWKELGFDAAVVQNGYSFIEYETDETGKKLPGVVDDSLAMAKKYGLGMEIEVSGMMASGDDEAYDRLFKCVYAAYSAGLMNNGLAMYYQGGGPGTFYHCAKSGNSVARSAYDLVYQYVSGTFTSYKPVIAPDQFVIVKKGEDASGKFVVTDEDTAVGVLTTHASSTAANVTVLVDGYFFKIVAESDFIGEDSFTFQLSDGFNISDIATVKVYVVEDLLSIKSKNGKLKENSANIYNEAGTTTETDSTAYEVIVNSENKVIEVGGNNHTVPDGGYVIAANGDAQAYLKTYAKVGENVLYDTLTDSVVISGEVTSTPSDADTSEENSGGNTLLWIIVGDLALVIAGVGLYIFKKAKNKKGAVQQ